MTNPRSFRFAQDDKALTAIPDRAKGGAIRGPRQVPILGLFGVVVRELWCRGPRPPAVLRQIAGFCYLGRHAR